MKGFFKYNCDFWDDIEEKRIKVKGIVYAEDYAAAMSKIEEYYGKNNINSISVEGLEPSDIYELD